MRMSRYHVALAFTLLACALVVAWAQEATKPVAVTPPPAKEIQAAPAKASDPIVVSMKLNDEEFNSFTALVDKRDQNQTKMELLQTQMENLQLKIQALQPELDKTRRAASDAWGQICKARNVDPAKHGLQLDSRTIMPAPPRQ